MSKILQNCLVLMPAQCLALMPAAPGALDLDPIPPGAASVVVPMEDIEKFATARYQAGKASSVKFKVNLFDSDEFSKFFNSFHP